MENFPNIDFFVSNKEKVETELKKEINKLLEPTGFTVALLEYFDRVFPKSYLLIKPNDLVILSTYDIYLDKLNYYFDKFFWGFERHGLDKTKKDVIKIKQSFDLKYLLTMVKHGDDVIYYDIKEKRLIKLWDNRKEYLQYTLNSGRTFYNTVDNENYMMRVFNLLNLGYNFFDLLDDTHSSVIANFDGENKQFDKHIIIIYTYFSLVKKLFYFLEDHYSININGQQLNSSEDKLYFKGYDNLNLTNLYVVMCSKDGSMVEFVKGSIENFKHVWGKNEKKYYWNTNRTLVSELID